VHASDDSRTAASQPALADRAIDVAVTAGVAVLVLVGFATSYHTLLDLAATVGGYPRWLAPAVPLSFDLGIVVLSLKVAQAAREGRHAPVLRLLVMLLSAVTVLANASAVPGTAARLLHAVPPAMFVVCFESAVITMRRHALQARGAWPQPIPRQHPLRWLLAPRSTWTTWRDSVLADVDPPAARDMRRRMSLDVPAEARPATTVKLPPSCDVAKDGRTSALKRSDRETVIARALQRNAALTAPALRALLTEAGYAVSLRTVQRLRAAAVRQPIR
jgi:hypothetical protein